MVDTTAANSDTARQNYQAFEFNLNARLPRGATVFGGLIVERTQTVNCDVNDPNLLRFCDQTGELYPGARTSDRRCRIARTSSSAAASRSLMG